MAIAINSPQLRLAAARSAMAVGTGGNRNQFDNADEIALAFYQLTDTMESSALAGCCIGAMMTEALIALDPDTLIAAAKRVSYQNNGRTTVGEMAESFVNEPGARDADGNPNAKAYLMASKVILIREALIYTQRAGATFDLLTNIPDGQLNDPAKAAGAMQSITDAVKERGGTDGWWDSLSSLLALVPG